MIAVSEQYQFPPKDFRKNLLWRSEMLDKCKDNEFLQKLIRERCKRDRLYFINGFVWTFDPRTEMGKLPFITYPFQDKIILWDHKCLELGIDNLVEKSRDMGATWMLLCNDFHEWLFSKEQIEIRWGSRKEQYVDTKGDMDSIFEKFRFLVRSLPDWMLPEGFSEKDHALTMRLINPATKSSITGEATNDNFSRGGRKKRTRMDEFAFWDCDENAWRSCADATNCRTALSTPNGPANKFATLAKDPEIELVEIHWTLHPKKNVGAYYLSGGKKIPIDLEKDPWAAYKIWKRLRRELPPGNIKGGVVRSDWYDAECERRSNDDIAQELDIDYLRSGRPFFDLRALYEQKKWEYYQRPTPSAPIPHGKYITGVLVERQNAVYQFREQVGGWLRVFRMPDKIGQYVLSGDTAEGLEKGDDSFGVVRSKYTGNTVATFKGKYEPDDFARKLQMVGAWYNQCVVAPENNNHGHTVCTILKDMDCDLYLTTKINPNTGKVLIQKPGFTTSGVSRPKMLDVMREEIRLQSVEVRDPDIISQCETFVHNANTGKAEAEGKFKDDGVIAFAIAGQVIREQPYIHRASALKNRVKAMAARQNTKKNAGFGFSKK